MKMPNPQNSGTGSLVPIHLHNNFELLQLFTDVEGKLYYKGEQVGSDINTVPTVKADEHNALQLTVDNELFVDGTYFLTQSQYEVLSKFNYSSSKLTFDSKEIELDVTDADIDNMINEVWADIDGNSAYSWLKVS